MASQKTASHRRQLATRRELADGFRRPHPADKKIKRGAAMVEAAITLSVTIFLIFGMLDLSIGVFRNNVMAHAAREGVRRAIVHGNLSKSPWGPTTFSGNANDSHPLAQAIVPYLATLNLQDVTVTGEWLDGNNKTGSRVRVTVSSTYRPLLTSLFGNSMTLRSASVLPITH